MRCARRIGDDLPSQRDSDTARDRCACARLGRLLVRAGGSMPRPWVTPAASSRVDRGICTVVTEDGPVRASWSGAAARGGGCRRHRRALHGRLVHRAHLARRSVDDRGGARTAYGRRSGRTSPARPAARSSSPTSTWSGSSSACTPSRTSRGSSACSRWPGRAARVRWSCSPRPTWSRTRTTWPTRYAVTAPARTSSSAAP